MDLSERVYRSCHISDRLFAINPYLPQQNFYSQQLRALALAMEIVRRHLDDDNYRVTVVGGGVAGRTLSAAFYALGADVTLVDNAGIPFQAYRNASHRELHPNIIFWPFQTPVPVTALPFLNWAQGPADEVVDALESEWNEAFAGKITVNPATAVLLDRKSNPFTVELDDGGRLKSAVCVLATGFADERRLGKLKTPGYWSPEAICHDGTKFLVSGSGDGGLIDSLSPFLGKDVTKAAHQIATRITKKSVTQRVRNVEERRSRNKGSEPSDSADPCDFYETFQFEPEDAAILKKYGKGGKKHTTLVYKTTSAYSQSAAPINKLLVSHFANQPIPNIVLVKGNLQKEDGQPATLNPTDGLPSAIEPDLYDKILVRHGAPASVIKLLLDDERGRLIQNANKHATELRGLTKYDTDAYRWSRSGVSKAKIGMLPIANALIKAMDQICKTYQLKLNNIRYDCNTFGDNPEIYFMASEEVYQRACEIGLVPGTLGAAKLSRQVKSKNYSRAPRHD